MDNILLWINQVYYICYYDCKNNLFNNVTIAKLNVLEGKNLHKKATHSQLNLFHSRHSVVKMPLNCKVIFTM